MEIGTTCAQSGRALRFELDSDLNYRGVGDDANPLVFVPLVDFASLSDPSIIDAF